MVLFLKQNERLTGSWCHCREQREVGCFYHLWRSSTIPQPPLPSPLPFLLSPYPVLLLISHQNYKVVYFSAVEKILVSILSPIQIKQNRAEVTLLSEMINDYLLPLSFFSYSYLLCSFHRHTHTHTLVLLSAELLPILWTHFPG